jgi:hypothetical protein
MIALALGKHSVKLVVYMGLPLGLLLYEMDTTEAIPTICFMLGRRTAGSAVAPETTRLQRVVAAPMTTIGPVAMNGEQVDCNAILYTQQSARRD